MYIVAVYLSFTTTTHNAMTDMDVFAAMGISGFGKAAKKRDLDPSRFDVAKRPSDPVSSYIGLTPRVNHPRLIHRKNRPLNQAQAKLRAAHQRRLHPRSKSYLLTGQKKMHRTIVQMQNKRSPNTTPLLPHSPPRLSFLSLMRQRSKSTPKSSQRLRWTQVVRVCSAGPMITTASFGISVE